MLRHFFDLILSFPVLKIIGLYSTDTCCGSPAAFWLNESCVLRPGRPFFIPDWDGDFRLHPVLALRIDHVGKGMPARFVHRYVRQASVWLHARAMRTLESLAACGAPLASALAFDSSIISAPFADMTLEEAAALYAEISVKRPGQSHDDTNLTVSLAHEWNPADTIAAIASRNTLRTGDIFLFPMQGGCIPADGPAEIDIDLRAPKTENLLHFKLK